MSRTSMCVFLSCSHKDEIAVARIRQGLIEEGFQPVWYVDDFRKGDDWDVESRRHATMDPCVIVHWSSHSVDNPKVKHEALIAAEQKTFLPVFIAPKPGHLPLGFAHLIAVDLAHWKGDRNDEAWKSLVGAIYLKFAQRYGAQSSSSDGNALSARPTKKKRLGFALLALATAGLASFIAGQMLPGQFPANWGWHTSGQWTLKSPTGGEDTTTPLVVRSLGADSIITRWSDLANFSGLEGLKFKTALENSRGSTWYLVNLSPYAFPATEIIQLMKKSVENGNTVYWSYQTPDASAQSKSLQLMWRFLYSHEVRENCRSATVTLCKTLHQRTIEIESSLADSNSDNRLKIFHSDAPTFYFAFLSVPGTNAAHVNLSSAPPGTFGFVMPYSHFPKYEKRPAFWFQPDRANNFGRDDLATKSVLLDYYFGSTVRFFERGAQTGPHQYLYPTRFRPQDPDQGGCICLPTCQNATLVELRRTEPKECHDPTEAAVGPLGDLHPN